MIENPLTEFEQLAKDIGLTEEQKKTANKLWGGTRCYIPIIPGSERDKRHKEVLGLLQAGKTYAEIEEQIGLSERQIRRIEAEDRLKVKIVK